MTGVYTAQRIIMADSIVAAPFGFCVASVTVMFQ